MAVKKVNPRVRAWIDARTRHHLTDVQVRMARKLGLDPNKLGNLDQPQQRKRPLPEFIEDSYRERFGRTTPETSLSGEEGTEGNREKRRGHRENRETPRASTIPAYPRQRIDD
jgi:hypothetical protein